MIKAKEQFNNWDYYRIIEPDLKQIQKSLLSINRQVDKISKDEDIPTIKSRIFVLINEMEKLAIKGREIPLYAEAEEYDVRSIQDTNISITENKEIIKMEIPLLLPKVRSNKANKTYLVGLFHDAFKKYFTQQKITRYNEPVVIWFEQQYKTRSGKQGFRDHDNVETKIVKDLLSPYVVLDDSPAYCDDFHSSKVGTHDATFIHIVPKRIFATYYSEKIKNESIQ